MPASRVLEFQRRSGATIGQAYGWQVPASYSSLAEEYEAATNHVGLLDRSYVGRLRLTGEDGLDLLNRLSTNDVEELVTAGQGMYTVLTSNKGRILDLLFVLRLDDGLLVLTGPESRGTVAEWIDFYTFAEDVTVEDVTEDMAMLAVMGPKAPELLDELTGHEVSSLDRFHSASTKIGDIKVLVIRTDFASGPGYDLCIPASSAERLWRELLERGAAYGIGPVGLEASEVVRIERVIPASGKELSEEFNPLEANMLDYISFNKGCYVGQEVVARLNTYQKVQKHLVSLTWDLDADPLPDVGLMLEGKRVGTLTSAVKSPHLQRGIGLGYVRKAQAQSGAQLTIETAGGEIIARVEGTPATAGDA